MAPDSLDSSSCESLPELLPPSSDEQLQSEGSFYKCMRVSSSGDEADAGVVPLELTLSRPASIDESATTPLEGPADLSPYSFVVKVPRGCSRHVDVPHVHVFTAKASDIGLSRYRTLSYDEKEICHHEHHPIKAHCACSARVESDPPLAETVNRSGSGNREIIGLGLYRSHSWPVDSRVHFSNVETNTDWASAARALLGDLAPHTSTADL